MFGRSKRAGMAGLAAAGVAALLAAGCSSAGTPPGSSASSGTPVSGGTATIALPAGITQSWIFPFYAVTNSSVYNDQQFEWLLYRPLYMFGNNTSTSVSINYPLSPADAPVYSNGGKTVTVTMKGWKWSDGESVDAQSVIFFLNMVEAEKANWYAYSTGLLPDNVVSYQATSPDQLTIQLNAPYSSLWYTYNQLAELNPMPLAWDVTSMGAAPGSGGCSTDSAADNWAKCQAVYTFLNDQAKQTATFATSPLWSVVDGPWKLSSYNVTGQVTFVPNVAYSGPVKPRLSAVKVLPYTDDSTLYTALRTGILDVGNIPSQDLPQKSASSAVPTTNPLGSGYYLEPFYNFGIQYMQPNFNNPAVGYLIRQLYIRQALQEVMDQPGIDTAIWRGYSFPTSGPVPTTPPNQWTPSIQNENGGQGPYPFSISKAKALLTSHGWALVGGVMTCQDPASCGAGITKGEQLKITVIYPPAVASTQQMWEVYKSDASKAGIDVSLVGQSFNSIISESLPCAPMGPSCSVEAFGYGGWAFDGPGFEPTGEPLFSTGAGSNSGNYSDATMNNLITRTHVSNSLAVFDQYATYGAEQLPVIWVPNPYLIEAVNSKLHNVTFNPMYTLLPEYWYFTK